MTHARAAVLLALCSAALAVLVPRGVESWRAGILLLPIILALLVPYASSFAHPLAGPAASIGFLLGAAAGALIVGLRFASVLCLLADLAGFALLLLACCSLARARRARPAVVLLAGAVPGFLLLGTVFYADPLVTALAHAQRAQGDAILLAVSANPMLEISARVGGEDLLQRTSLYDTLAISNLYHDYPLPWQVALFFATASLLLLGVARACRREV